MKREQNKAKRKMSTIKKIVLLVLLLVLITGCCVIGFAKYKDITTQQTDSASEVKVENNQEIILGQITSIAGNEMTFSLVEEVEVTTSQTTKQGNKSESANRQELSGNTVSGNAPSGEAPSGEMPTGEAPSGGMPTGEVPSGEMPSIGEQIDDTQAMGDNIDRGQSNYDTTATNTSKADKTDTSTVAYQSLGEEETMVVPVGTQVITKLGTTTTFSRLAVGDVMQLLVEKEDSEKSILKIWIIG